ncbi:hypothetical protein LFL96_10630 [Paraburkholderia sp. D15]|uniref:hypothetical protein n=1 Tax=Paraburkholderia sp. D15 TaxID=2880218 RepID=UPI00247A825B|nr:hypothetical protein [Paraburkholderia sp. D15]WGS48261.1 hypothetical protein LFL96_10630 [Paraburkholderia sp. D15]
MTFHPVARTFTQPDTPPIWWRARRTQAVSMRRTFVVDYMEQRGAASEVVREATRQFGASISL